MADGAKLSRRLPLEGRTGGARGVSLVPAGSAWRMSLRVRVEDVDAVSQALGLALPQVPKTSVIMATGRMALWLGPDEWLLIDDVGDPLTDLAKSSVLHSAVDVSHRNTAILVEGPGAQATLQAGCPQNLSLRFFPVGACSRTVLGKIEVVILRTGETAFRLECWRSFSDYALAFLSDAAGDCLA